MNPSYLSIRILAPLLAFIAIVPRPAIAIDFEKELKPVLEAKCLGCHNPNTSKGDFSLHEPSDMLTKLVNKEAPTDSRLYKVTLPGTDGSRPEMPEKGDPLTDAERALLLSWIGEGAAWPEGLILREASKADTSWWAYQPLKTAIPQGPEPNPVDRFVSASLSEKGLRMNPDADRRSLIRRAYYDLIGLPPSPAEVNAFVQDPDPQAWEKLIDGLLASPHYGERWGRHWLDVVRFGESRGFERNLIIDDAWPFRDYVIRSINEDKPFDQLIREHIAGDIIGKGDPEVEVGTTFLVAGPYDDVGNQDKEAIAQIRANTLDEIINATGEAFLGMTLGCARCHDHKFDPIKQEDYYSLYATFSGIRHGSRTWATPEDVKQRNAKLAPLNAEKAALNKELQKIEAAIAAKGKEREKELSASWTRPKVDRTGTEETFEPVEARFLRFISEGNDSSPGNRNSFNIDEFEVWSSGENPRNVALSSNGAKATGAARTIEDFPNAYGPQLAIDGRTGARFIATGGNLTIEFAKPETINRVLFSSARGETVPGHRKFSFVCDYRIHVAMDGKAWTEVANGFDRKVVRGAHKNHRLRSLSISQEEQKAIAKVRADIAAVDQKIRAIPPLPTVWIGSRSPNDAKGPFHIFIGGSPQKPGKQVVPMSPSTLGKVAPSYELKPEAVEADRRLELADWITHPDNPLTPRVLANRVWQYHFGTGIVDTPNDFGFMGGRPTHPELLDFLALELKRNGWRIKTLHKLIMTSRAYTQSTDWHAEAARVDGDSRLLWRFPPRRLSAEEIRDTILSVAGALDTSMGGPGFRLYKFMRDNVCTYEPLDEHGPATYRRAVYHQNARASVVDLMTDFDQPDCALSIPKRAETTTPLQALTLLNHDFTLDMAEALAARIAEEATKPEEQIRAAFEIAYQRAPLDEEKKVSGQVIEKHGLRALCRAILNSSELIHLN